HAHPAGRVGDTCVPSSNGAWFAAVCPLEQLDKRSGANLRCADRCHRKGRWKKGLRIAFRLQALRAKAAAVSGVDNRCLRWTARRPRGATIAPTVWERCMK